MTDETIDLSDARRVLNVPEPSNENLRQRAFKDSLISAAELAKKTFEPVRWAVPDILPEGVTLLAGAPKLGKSWLCLDVAIAVSAGGVALGKTQVEQGDVLYAALEDNQRRLQRRLSALLPDGTAPPERLTLTTIAPRMDDGLLTVLSDWIEQADKPRLIIIDTLAKIRPGNVGKLQQYDADYQIGSELAVAAAKYGVTIVVVCHTRKAESEDPLDLISGTLGLSGGCDGVLVLQRARGAGDAQLYVTGRDIENEGHYALSFDKTRGAWTMLGPADQVPGGDAQAEILALLQIEPLSPADVAKALDRNRNTVRQLIMRMVRSGLLIQRFDKRYEPASASSGVNPYYVAKHGDDIH